MSSPYAPPSAPVRDPAPQKGSAIKAVLLGVLVDLGGSIVAGSVMTILYGMTLIDGAENAAELESTLANTPMDSWFSIATIAVGCMFSVAGGYVCARIARHSEYRLGAIVAGCGVAVGLVLSSDYYSPLVDAALAIASVIAVMGGVWLGIRRNTRAAQ